LKVLIPPLFTASNISCKSGKPGTWRYIFKSFFDFTCDNSFSVAWPIHCWSVEREHCKPKIVWTISVDALLCL
jgi:hypothetical protein